MVASDGTSVGGAYFQNSTTTEPFVFGGLTGVSDSADIYYLDAHGSSQTVEVTGAAALTIVSTGALVIKKVSLKFPRQPGAVVTVRRVAGMATVVGVELYDSTVGSVSILNIGWSGARTAEWTRAQYQPDPNYPGNYETLDLDLAVVMLGANNIYMGEAVADYSTELTTLVRRRKATGADVLLLTPIAMSISTKPLALQTQFAHAMLTIAKKESVPSVDVFRLFGSYEQGNASGLYRNPVHPNGLGYMKVAAAVVEQVANP